MKREKGFTLIELLAVIVILAIILLIATPIVLNVIESARAGAFKSSAGYLMKAAENKYLTNQLNEKEEGLVYIYENGIAKDGKDLDYKGETPKNGTIVVRKDGKIGIAIDNGKWCAIKNYYDDNIKMVKLTEDNCKLSDVPEEIVKGFDKEKGVNKPVLTEGMTPIKWNETEEITTTKSDPEWYDYSEKKWANAKTADGSYWVWIPRYAYKIISGYHTSTAREIDIKFLKGYTNKTVDGTVVEKNGYEVGIKDTSMHYFQHPAFTFGEEEILGYWVAKFEPSVANQSDLCYTSASATNCNKITLVPKIIPNARSWRYTDIGNQFDISINMKSNATYGWGSSGVDTHMMKNSEWGAVAYLSQSIYGANDEIWVNPNQNYITGCAGNSVNASYTSTCNEYNTINGQKTSTTHNITGVYDLGGGAYESVASYIDNGESYLVTYGSSIINSNRKYKDIYVKGTTDNAENNYSSNKNKYGDGIYETSIGTFGATSWYREESYMPYKYEPFFRRGGYYGTSGSGIFAFRLYNSGRGEVSFRPIVIANSAINDITPPTITIKGNNPVILYTTASAYTDAGATASDNLDGDITSKITVTSNLAFGIAGEYQITYTVEDSNKNKTTVIRTIKITETPSVTQISTGSSHIIYLMSDGTVKAVGNNQFGQLVDGNLENKKILTTIPSLSGIKHVSAGSGYTVFLMEDGTVKAVGVNDLYQLGNGTTSSTSTPIIVPNLNIVKAISSSNHNIYLLEDGTAKAVGYNNKGQLGDGSTTNRSTPIIIPGLTGIKQVSVGHSHTVFLMSDGTVKAAGNNQYGQLGDGSTTDRSSVITIPSLSGVKQISAGSQYTMFLMEDSTVRAVGNNQTGQLGDGTTINKSTPIVIPGLSDVKQISASNTSTLFLMKNGTVRATGRNDYGQFGNGTTTQSLSPVEISGLNNVKEIIASNGFTIFLMEDGTVKAAGYNALGQLGDGTTTDRSTPIDVNLWP